MMEEELYHVIEVIQGHEQMKICEVGRNDDQSFLVTISTEEESLYLSMIEECRQEGEPLIITLKIKK